MKMKKKKKKFGGNGIPYHVGRVTQESMVLVNLSSVYASITGA